MPVELYYEDLEPGAVYETGGMTLTEDAVVRFALDWDSQPFHIDREAAKASVFGGLVASGLHTLAVTFRLCNHEGLFTRTALAGLGFDKVRFHEPVHVGSTLRARVTVTGRRMSGSRPDTGIAMYRVESFDEKGTLVLSLEVAHLIAVRGAGTFKA